MAAHTTLLASHLKFLFQTSGNNGWFDQIATLAVKPF
jgi:hypothetical protein